MLSGQPNNSWQLCFPLKMHARGSEFRLYDGSDLKTCLYMRWLGYDALVVVKPTDVYLLDFSCSGIQFHLLLSTNLCFISFLYHDLYCNGTTSVSYD